MTPTEAANWMFETLKTQGVLYQKQAARQLNELDETTTYVNKNFNLAISKEVLAEFKLLKQKQVVTWKQTGRKWFFRTMPD